MERIKDFSPFFDSHPLLFDNMVTKCLQQQRISAMAGQDSEVLENNLIGNSLAMLSLKDTILRAAPTDSTILIQGESGCGKEVVANCIHRLSKRTKAPFVALNCGAIPAELIESELFGHEKGAFTGAINQRLGKFEYANNGTLFLDEIGDMPFLMQVKLLRVLQEKVFERVGGNKNIRVNTRIITATHQDLETFVKEGKFREDLFYRLNVFPIAIPPLRSRQEDIPLLIDYFLSQLQPQYQAKLKFSNAAIDVLMQYPWPGNIRELANLIERLLILHPNETIDVSQIPERLMSNPITPHYETTYKKPDTSLSLKDQIAHFECHLIHQALINASGNVSQAAKILKVGRTTLIEKIKKYEINKIENSNQENLYETASC